MMLEATKPLITAVSYSIDTLPDATVEEVVELARKRLPTDGLEIERILHLALTGIAKNQLKARSIEKWNDQGELFSDEVYKKRVSYVRPSGESASIECGIMNYDHHQLYRERQILNLRNSNRAFERWEQRRQKLYVVMKDDPNLTTIQAVAILNTLTPA